MSTVAVAGGTGLVGRLITEALRATGRPSVVLARRAGVDVVTGHGLDAALEGVGSVVDVTNVVTSRTAVAQQFFGTATRNLTAAGARAGVRHHVVLSIVGIDRVGLGYYRGKLHQEEVALAGPVPVTVLRATQFHEFADQFLGRTSPLALVPRMASQPVAAREVAEALLALADGPALGRAPDLAGPRPEQMPDLVRRLVRARHWRRLVLPVRVPGAAGSALAEGGLLPATAGPRGRQSFEEWLGSVDRDRGLEH